MHKDHPDAGNLYCRLFSYVPRQGEERKREPIEDFCTEALAYLLIKSRNFRVRFVREILCESIDAEPLTVNTQSFSASEDEDNERNSKIDILLELDDKPRIGIEAKVNAPPGPGQFEGYEKNYGGAKLFLLAKRSYPQEHQKTAEDHSFKIIYWEDVQECLANFKDDDLADLANQFAEFLATQGMKYMKMIQNPKAISNFRDAVKLVNEWSVFLSKKLPAELFPNERMKHPEWGAQGPPDWPTSSFSTIVGKGSSKSKYAGFKMDDDGSTWCYYEDSIEWVGAMPSGSGGDWSEESPNGYRTKISKLTNGGIWLCHQTRYPQLSGNLTDKLLEIFKEMKKACEEQRQKLRAAHT